jgi:hypothetical protein
MGPDQTFPQTDSVSEHEQNGYNTRTGIRPNFSKFIYKIQKHSLSRQEFSAYGTCPGMDQVACRHNNILTQFISHPDLSGWKFKRFCRYRDGMLDGCKCDRCRQLMNWDKSAATSRGGPGPFQGPSSYPLLCWWSLIAFMLITTQCCRSFFTNLCSLFHSVTSSTALQNYLSYQYGYVFQNRKIWHGYCIFYMEPDQPFIDRIECFCHQACLKILSI